MMVLNTTKNPAVLIIPNDLQYTPAISHFVQCVSIAHGFSKSDALKICLAVEEAVVNVIRHAYDADENAVFTLKCKPTVLGMEFEVTDQGIPLDQHITAHFSVEQPDAIGLGSLLMLKTMDEVTYNNLGIRGKSLLLVKHFTDRRTASEELFHATEQVRPTFEQKAAHTFAFRLLKPEEASDIARLAYRTYGYTYVYEHIYFPDRIVKLNENRELVSYVAVTQEREIAGHVGLITFREFKGVCEMAVAMMHPKFRGFGLLDELSAAVIKEAQKMEFTSVFVQANTVHTRSQSTPIKMGFKPCMLLLSYASALDVKNITTSCNERQSVIVSFLSFEQHVAKNMYAPQRHKAIIQKIYDTLGADYSFMEGVTTEIAARSTLSVQVNHVSKLMRITVYDIGSDIVHQMKTLLHQLRAEKLELCELLLNMKSPGILSHVDDIEQLGFLFSGVFPCRETGDFITMILLNGVNACFDNILLRDNNGQYLLEYIRNDYTGRFL